MHRQGGDATVIGVTTAIVRTPIGAERAAEAFMKRAIVVSPNKPTRAVKNGAGGGNGGLAAAMPPKSEALA